MWSRVSNRSAKVNQPCFEIHEDFFVNSRNIVEILKTLYNYLLSIDVKDFWNILHGISQ